MGGGALDFRFGEKQSKGRALECSFYLYRSGEEEQKEDPPSGLRMDISKATASRGPMHKGRSNRTAIHGLTIFILSHGGDLLRSESNPFTFPVEQKCPKSSETGNSWRPASPTRRSGALRSFPAAPETAHTGQPEAAQAPSEA